MHSSSPPPRCADCPFKREERLCCVPGGKHPPDCPSAAHTDLVEKSRQAYAQPDIRHFAPSRPGGAAQLRQTARRRAHALPPRIFGNRALPGPWATIVWACSFCIGLRRGGRGRGGNLRGPGPGNNFRRLQGGRPVRANWASRVRSAQPGAAGLSCAIRAPGRADEQGPGGISTCCWASAWATTLPACAIWRPRPRCWPSRTACWGIIRWPLSSAAAVISTTSRHRCERRT